MIYETAPKGFNPMLEVVSCFVEHDREILLLHRQDHKNEGNTWGVPAGKKIDNETLLEGVIREIKQETGFIIQTDMFSYYGKVFVRYPNKDFIYHMFHTEMNKKKKVELNYDEHKDFRWISPKEALGMPLIKDLGTCIKLFYKF